MQAALDEFTQIVPSTAQACAYTNIGLSFFIPGIRWLVAPILGVTFAVTMVASSIGVHHLYRSCKNKIDEKNQPLYQVLALVSVFVISILFTSVLIKKALNLMGRKVSYKVTAGLALFDLIPFICSAPRKKPNSTT